MSRLRCTMPSPPACASAIAVPASVTVSIAAERRGMLRIMSLVSLVFVSTSIGCTSEAPGSNRTSSKVSPLRSVLIILEDFCGMAATFSRESRLRFFIHEDAAYVQVYAGGLTFAIM